MTDQPVWVLDTNTLVSRLLVPGGVAGRAVDLALKHGVLLVSEATLTELVEVIGHRQFDAYLTDEDRRRFIALLGGISRLAPVHHHVHACRDPKDDKFLDVALAGGARAIVTGDHDLLKLDPFHDVRIISPPASVATITPARCRAPPCPALHHM